MTDQDREGFQRRVAAIRAARGGDKWPTRPRRRLPLLGPLAVTLIVVLTLKGVLHAQLGAATYDLRVADLQAGNAIERVGAWVLRADAATLWISARLSTLLH